MDLKTSDEVQQYVDAELNNLAGAPLDICGTWKKARPVAMFLLKFLPPSWKAILQPLASALDTFCPNP